MVRAVTPLFRVLTGQPPWGSETQTSRRKLGGVSWGSPAQFLAWRALPGERDFSSAARHPAGLTHLLGAVGSFWPNCDGRSPAALWMGSAFPRALCKGSCPFLRRLLQSQRVHHRSCFFTIPPRAGAGPGLLPHAQSPPLPRALMQEEWCGPQMPAPDLMPAWSSEAGGWGQEAHAIPSTCHLL